MQALQLLETFTAAGLAVSLTPDYRLMVTPAKALTDDLRASIKAHKAVLVDYLSRTAANDPSEAELEAQEERAAIIEYDGRLSRTEAERLARLDAHPAPTVRKTVTFTARLSRFSDKGLSLAEAEWLVDKLATRDRDRDDRRLCLECAHLQGCGPWRCGNWQAADVGRQWLARDLVLILQRCDGFRDHLRVSKS